MLILLIVSLIRNMYQWCTTHYDSLSGLRFEDVSGHGYGNLEVRQNSLVGDAFYDEKSVLLYCAVLLASLTMYLLRPQAAQVRDRFVTGFAYSCRLGAAHMQAQPPLSSICWVSPAMMPRSLPCDYTAAQRTVMVNCYLPKEAIAYGAR